jgi:molecular chaperone GrpE
MSDEQDQNNEVSIQQLQAELDTVTNHWKRALADYENYKRRSEAEKKELLEFAKEVTVVKLLPTLDTLAQAIRHMPELKQEAGSMNNEFEKQYANWQTGMRGILVQLDRTLEEMGVKRIEALGKKFDPLFHEAVREAESESDDGVIVEELQSGFELHGKVIRPSQVVISKKAAKGGG